MSEMVLEHVFYLENFDCPTDEIIIKSESESMLLGDTITLNGQEDNHSHGVVMSTARLAATQQVFSLSSSANPRGSGNSAGADSPDPAESEASQLSAGNSTSRVRDVILIPASDPLNLQHAIQANGVTVVDVRSLQTSGGGAESSGHSSPGTEQGTVIVQETEGSHFITVSGDGSGVGYHVQYVEPQEIYTQPQQGQNQMDPLRTYPVYQTESNNVATGYAQASSASWTGQYPQHYLVAGQALDQMVAAHHQRTTASPDAIATVQWLLENYETAESVSLPRSTLYSHYLHHCDQRDLEPVNAASFGKLIRSVFVGLRTRRLGTRGNSKYHYYGIRVKPSSALAARAECGEGKARCERRDEAPAPPPPGAAAAHQHHHYLGDGSHAIPDFPDVALARPLPGDCTAEDVDTLKSIYREHLEAFLDAVLSLELSTVEQLWREFWRHNSDNSSAAEDCEEEKYLSKSKLYLLCIMPEIQEWVRNVDILFYQKLVEVLLPDVLRPIPSALTQAIRNFAKGVEQWLAVAMCGAPTGMVKAKASPAAALAASLRRYTSLNHLAQAARAVLHNQQQIQQMLADLNRVDFRSVQEQAAWACGCSSFASASQLQAEFKATLGRGASLEQWASWLEAAVRRALRPHERQPRYAERARHFLLKWSFYSSMVIRDLTLRSAASFGSFHLIRLLYDEYMFYLVEQRVAAHEGRPPISVMAEFNMTEGSDDAKNDINDAASTSDYEDSLLVNNNVKHESETPNKKMKIS